MFIGANIDAVETAARYGIDADRAVNYHGDKEGTECINPLEEKRLFLHYVEMKVQTQIEEEGKVIRALEKLNKNFLESLATLKSEVHFRRSDSHYVVDFQTGGFEGLSCRIGTNGEIEILTA